MRLTRHLGRRTIAHGIATLVLAWAYCGAHVRAADAPVVFWASDPVRPDETVQIIGGQFGATPTVDVRRLADAGEVDARPWTQATVWQGMENAAKFAIPADWRPGCFAFRIRNGRSVSPESVLNAPDCRWIQGNSGLGATPGGWVRVFGKSLSLLGAGGADGSHASRIELVDTRGKSTLLPPRNVSCWSLTADLPAELPSGTYQVRVHNGFGGEAAWRDVEPLVVGPAPRADWPTDVFDAKELGLSNALKKAEENGGGIVYLPRGKYTIGNQDPILVPERTVLRGEDIRLSYLCWRDMDEPPSALIEGRDFALENLTVYCQFYHRDVVKVQPGSNGFRMDRVRIRANTFYRLGRGAKGMEFRGRVLPALKGGLAVSVVEAKNFSITNCDIYTDCTALRIQSCSGGLAGGNHLQYGVNGFFVRDSNRITVENNTVEGCDPGATGNFVNPNLSLIHVASNTFRRVYGWDREVFTFDLSDSAYLGPVAGTDGCRVTLAQDPEGHHKGIRDSDSHAGWCMTIQGGRGMGQYRRIVEHNGREWTVDKPWVVVPDASSLIGITPFMGNVFFIGNTLIDAGIVQTYKCSIDNVFAENKFVRSSGLLPLCGRPGKQCHGAWQVSWYNQALDNTFPEGGGWGGAPASLSFLAVNGSGEKAFWGPVSWGGVARRNTFDCFGLLRVSNACWDVLFENCTVRKSDYAVRIDGARGETDDPSKALPKRILFRNNTFEDVGRPLVQGSAAKVPLFIPALPGK